MKKVKLIIIITILILLSVVILYIKRAKTFPHKEEEVVEVTNADLAFAVLGDVHENIEHFEEAIDDFCKINANMDALILNGDVVDQGIEEQYDSVKKP